MNWRKSSFCAASECAEAAADDGGVLVRDSADPDGPSLWFSGEAWAEFTKPLTRRPA